MYDTSNPYNWKHYKTVNYPFGQWTLTDADLSPDNKWLAYTSLASIVCLAPTDPNDTGDPYSLDLGYRTATSRSDFPIYSARFSGDGRNIVAGTGLASIVVYDIERRKRLHHVRGHNADVNAVAFADKLSPHILVNPASPTTHPPNPLTPSPLVLRLRRLHHQSLGHPLPRRLPPLRRLRRARRRPDLPRHQRRRALRPLQRQRPNHEALGPAHGAHDPTPRGPRRDARHRRAPGPVRVPLGRLRRRGAVVPAPARQLARDVPGAPGKVDADTVPLFAAGEYGFEICV